MHKLKPLLLLLASAALSLVYSAAAFAQSSGNNPSCVTCGVIDNYLRGAFNLHEKLFTVFAGGVQNLIAVVLVVWLLVEAGKMLTPFTPLDKASKVFNGAISRLGLAFLIILAIQSPKIYLNYIFYPIANSAVTVSMAVLQAASSVAAPGEIATPNCEAPPLSTDKKEVIIGTLSYQSCYAQENLKELAWLSVRIVFAEFGVNFDQNRNAAANRSQENFFMAISKFALKFFEAAATFADVILRILAAMVLVVIYGWMWMIYPVRLLNLVFQWALVTILSPLLMASFIFPSVRPTAFAGLRALGHAALTLIFTAIVIGVIMTVAGQMAGDIARMKGSLSDGGGGEALSTYDYWMLLVTGLIMNHLLGQAPKLAGVFIQSRMETDVASGLIGTVIGFFKLAVSFVPGGKAVVAGMNAVGVR
ncbi:MAG: hypothetical protein ACK5XX_08060 [Holosporales bacterium]|nr:hypothetical protein [Thalassospira sp.]